LQSNCNVFSTLQLDTDASPSVLSGSAVSLTASGQVRAGGGTSIYTDTTEITATCPNYLDIDAIRDTNFIVSFMEGTTGKSTLQLLDMTAPNEGSVVYSVQRTGDVYEVATLDQAGALFVAVQQDVSAGEDQAVVFAGKVDTEGTQFSLGADTVYSADAYSLNPTISRLSDTTFAMSYYDTADGVPIVSTRVGMLLTAWNSLYLLGWCIDIYYYYYYCYYSYCYYYYYCYYCYYYC
jgi:hypothetical protein